MTTTKLTKAEKEERREVRRLENFTEQAHIIIKLVKDSLPELTEYKTTYTHEEKNWGYQTFWNAVNKSLISGQVKSELYANRKKVQRWIPNFFENHGTNEEHWVNIVEALHDPELTLAQLEWEAFKEEELAKQERELAKQEKARKKAKSQKPTLTERRKLIVQNPKSTAKELASCVNCKNVGVLTQLVEHPKFPVEAQKELLAKTYNRTVLEAMADSPVTSREVLSLLGENWNGWVRSAVGRNPKTPAKTLRLLAVDEKAPIRGAVAENPTTPVATLKKLAESKQWFVREAVAGNPRTPLELVVELANDSSPNVRRSAQENLESQEEGE